MADTPTPAADDRLIERLRQFEQAYPEDLFGPLTDEDRAKYGSSGIMDRTSAAMGRHMAKFTKMAADRIESQAK